MKSYTFQRELTSAATGSAVKGIIYFKFLLPGKGQPVILVLKHVTFMILLFSTNNKCQYI